MIRFAGVRVLLALCALLSLSSAWRGPTSIPPCARTAFFISRTTCPSRSIATIKTPTTIYLRRDFQSALALMGPGATIELIGMSPEGYLVKGDYRNNSVTGWILPADLPPGIDPALIAQARKNQARHNVVADAIAHKKVIRGMTPDEVQQSVGRPDQESSQTDDSGHDQDMGLHDLHDHPADVLRAWLLRPARAADVSGQGPDRPAHRQFVERRRDRHPGTQDRPEQSGHQYGLSRGADWLLR